jgi:hypothetical protein
MQPALKRLQGHALTVEMVFSLFTTASGFFESGFRQRAPNRHASPIQVMLPLHYPAIYAVRFFCNSFSIAKNN